MKKFIFIESTRPRKNGHMVHLMKLKNNGYYVEISLKTGKELMYGYSYTPEQIEYWKFKVYDVKKEKPQLWWRDNFANYIVDMERGEL